MRNIRNNITAIILGIVLAVSMALAVPAQESYRPAGIAACAVPIPASLPGEEKKDTISAVIGLSVLLVLVGGSLVFLQKKKEEEAE